jgi:hypothetical protein
MPRRWSRRPQFGKMARQASAAGAARWWQRMYDWLIVILVSLAGYVEAPAWFILIAAFGLSIEGWWGKLGLLRHSPRAISTKKTAYFVAGAISNLGLAGLGYLVGHICGALAP